MHSLSSLKEKILNIDDSTFEETALEVFRFQALNNQVYAEYLDGLNVKPESVRAIHDIPFLPISFFKTHEVKTSKWEPQKEFLSSGTTGMQRSKHLIEDVAYYRRVATQIYTQVYGELKDTTLLALLPSYQEQGSSGLINMVDHFMTLTRNPVSGYYLSDYAGLKMAIDESLNKGARVALFGVSFALLEFAAAVNGSLEGLTVIETGGMKGRGPEYTKAELHEVLKKGLGVSAIHSEYGMTELMSQAYSKGDGVFTSPNWMKIIIRELNDPFNYLKKGRTGGINVIDLANIHSCAFIETKDIGVVKDDNSFEILGRIDNSDLRGCNLLIS